MVLPSKKYIIDYNENSYRWVKLCKWQAKRFPLPKFVILPGHTWSWPSRICLLVTSATTDAYQRTHLERLRARYEFMVGLVWNEMRKIFKVVQISHRNSTASDSFEASDYRRAEREWVQPKFSINSTLFWFMMNSFPATTQKLQNYCYNFFLKCLLALTGTFDENYSKSFFSSSMDVTHYVNVSWICFLSFRPIRQHHVSMIPQQKQFNKPKSFSPPNPRPATVTTSERDPTASPWSEERQLWRFHSPTRHQTSMESILKVFLSRDCF